MEPMSGLHRGIKEPNKLPKLASMDGIICITLSQSYSNWSNLWKEYPNNQMNWVNKYRVRNLN